MGNSKAVKLTMVAALVVCGMAVGIAHASESEGVFTGAEIGTGEHVDTFVVGTQEPGDPLVFTSGESQVLCTEASMSAEIPGGTAEDFPLEFEFEGECSAGGFPATVFDNGCYLDLQTSETTVGGSFTGRADLKCPNGPAELGIYASESHGFRVCAISIPEQTGLEGAVVHNLEGSPDRLEVTLDVSGLAQTQSGLCGHSESSASLEGTATVEGVDLLTQEPVDISIAHK